MSRTPTQNTVAAIIGSIIATAAASAAPPAAEIPVAPNGRITGASWALTRLNDASDPLRSDYIYPDTRQKVRLYLIDTAVANPGGFFDANPNLTFLHSEIITGMFGPFTSSAFDHGTRMLSLIAGPGMGAALGTPIELVTYDIYNNGEAAGTTATQIARATNEVILDHTGRNDGVPALVLIAAGSTTSDFTVDPLETQLDDLVAEGIPVVISAGNQAQPADLFTPSRNGTQDGVICVGATATDNSRYFYSNHGNAVDLFAPGENVVTVGADGLPAVTHGTSVAGALVAATAITQLSICPELTPAGLEALLKQEAYIASSEIKLAQLPPFDSDGDGVPDAIETFYGTCPETATDCPRSPVVTCANGEAALAFTICANLFQPANPFVLADGRTWQVLMSHDFVSWTPAGGELHIGETLNGKVGVSYCSTTTLTSCYYRIQVSPPPTIP